MVYFARYDKSFYCFENSIDLKIWYTPSDRIWKQTRGIAPFDSQMHPTLPRLDSEPISDIGASICSSNAKHLPWIIGIMSLDPSKYSKWRNSPPLVVLQMVVKVVINWGLQRISWKLPDTMSFMSRYLVFFDSCSQLRLSMHHSRWVWALYIYPSTTTPWSIFSSMASKILDKITEWNGTFSLAMN